MAKLLKRIILTLFLLFVAYVVTVQVLRWLAFGEEEREALALMEQPVSAPGGSSGFKYLAFAGLAVPQDELDAALAREMGAFSQWHAALGERIVESEFGGESTGVYLSPAAEAYPVREAVPFPSSSCNFRESDCLARLAGNEDEIRAWLASDEDRLALAWQALRSDHVANPYPLGVDTPIAAFQVFRLPINAVALQALDGDTGGAQARACELLAASRRFLRQDGLLIDKMVNAALTQGAAGLVLAIRRVDPDAPLPAECGVALEPVGAADYFVCNSLRSEYAMVASLSRAMDEALARSWNPLRIGTRWLLIDDRLQRAWSARGFAPMCREESLALIASGRLPEVASTEFSKRSVGYWAAPMSSILSNIAVPAHDPYQRRLLDHAAVLRLQLAAIAHVNGELGADQVAEAAASPGYEISRDDEGWLLGLLTKESNRESEFRITLGVTATDAGGAGE